MAKKKKASPRRRSSSRRSGGLMGVVMHLVTLAGGYVAGQKIEEMLMNTFPDDTMRNGVLALGGAFATTKTTGMVQGAMMGVALRGTLGAADAAFPTLGIRGADMGALTDFQVDALEQALLDASDMNGTGDDYQENLAGMDDRGGALAGMDDRNDALAGPDEGGDEDDEEFEG